MEKVAHIATCLTALLEKILPKYFLIFIAVSFFFLKALLSCTAYMQGVGMRVYRYEKTQHYRLSSDFYAKYSPELYDPLEQ